jgi:putative glutamine amidotransferase
LLTAVKEPGNLQARSDMMMASMMGAIAFQKDLGAVHSCAHALGAVCDLHHGLANALMIDTVLAWNYEAVPAKFDELAHVCGVAGGGKAFVPWLRAQGQRGHHRAAGCAWRQGRASAAPGGDCHRRHLPPDQSAALHGGGLRARCSRRRCEAMAPGPPAHPDRLKIGVSACFLHPDPRAPRSPARRCSTSSSRCALGHVGGAMPVMVPSPTGDTARGDVGLADYAQWLDGLVCMAAPTCGPAAMARRRCKERWRATASATSTRSRWSAFVPPGKPVFGICRGLQLINVALAARCTRTPAPRPGWRWCTAMPDTYDQNFHDVDVVPGTRLASCCRARASRNHQQRAPPGHQGPGARLRGRGALPDDGVIEAIRHTGSAWVAAVQWHPEFHKPGTACWTTPPILQDFLAAARARRTRNNHDHNLPFTTPPPAN